jgi:hypothetical protein
VIAGVIFVVIAGLCVIGGIALGGIGVDPGSAPRGVVPGPSVIKPPADTSGAGISKANIGEGIWEVGVDVKAGKYKTDGAQDASIPMCYWDLRTGSETGDFVDQGVVNSPEAPGRVTLKKGQFFKTSGCKPWQPVK